MILKKYFFYLSITIKKLINSFKKLKSRLEPINIFKKLFIY